jgi:anti-sigma regulatory factor (Ser/Thr protein kinase)/GNAT superfamily N-acetyltransferase
MKDTKELGFLRIPNDQKLLPAVLSYTGKISKITGFSHDDCKKLQLAVEEACLNVINTSFIPDEDAEFDIHFLKCPSGIEIHIHDMGLPYEPGMTPVYNQAVDFLEQNLDGLGSFLISKTMDEYHFNNLGIQGKEVVLIKYFDTPFVAMEQASPVEPEIVKPPEPGLPVPQIDFDIRLMRPDEALEVCRCIYDCYGYSYANENIYFPERVAAMNQNGKLRSAVAMTNEGEMGGHFALIFYDKLPAEVGIAVTKKKFRGQGFARQLGEFLEMEARTAGLRGVQIKEVTAHPYTQKFCMKLGYKDCGLLLAHSPKSLSFKGIAETLKQRNSDVLGFKYLEKPKHRQIYAPFHHRAMINKLYNNIGDEVEFILSENPLPIREKCVTEVNIHHLRSLAEIFIIQIGSDITQVIRHEMLKIFREDIQVIELYLSLADPMTPVIFPHLEILGYIFTGILPETYMGDAIIMQYFNGVFIDYNEIILVSDVAKQLLEYVRKHDSHAYEVALEPSGEK